MTRAAVEALLYLMDLAFDAEGDEDSLLSNLRSVRDDDWLWTPPGGSRSIADIIGHVGACKFVYDNHMFGDGKMTWSDPVVRPQEQPTDDVAGTLSWLREGHQCFREHVAALDDTEILKLRRRPEGGSRETRWLIAVMIQHDQFHAGEINHIRALRQRNDRWAWESS